MLQLRGPVGVALLMAVAGAASCGHAPQATTEDEPIERIESLYKKLSKKFRDVPDLSPKELVELQEQGDDAIVVVDVRPDEEREVSMIPGAISKSEFEASRAEYEGKTVVAYCTIGYRSGLWAKDLRADGWEAKNLRGSILAWTHAELPLEDTDGPTKRVHVYAEDWALAAEGYEPVW